MAQLPPKAPGMPQNWPSFSYQMMQMPSSVAQPPSWVDEFLDFSSSRRNSHRRSVSDPIAFIEAPNNFIEDVEEEEECRNVVNINNAANTRHIGFDRLDDEQLSSMFSDVDVVNLPSTRSCNSSNPSSPTSTDQLNSDNDQDQKPLIINTSTDHGVEQALQVQIKQQQPKKETDDVEIEEHEGGGGGSPAESSDPNKFSFQANSADAIVDPKRVKRILANRQSAQRSRVRKLQYISELERSVTTLQTEVSALSPRVAFLDHQRLILNVDNSALKQRIAALAQDKIFKDAHQEALRKEIERLRKLYNEQNNHKNMAGAGGSDSSSPPPPQPPEQPTPTSFNNMVTSTAAEQDDQ